MTLSFVPDSIAWTFLGWTPGLRSLIEGQTLPCGCLVGSYLTWGNQVVVLVDSQRATCGVARHRLNAVLWASTSVAALERPELDEASPGPGLA
jgi:hypothetical protein